MKSTDIKNHKTSISQTHNLEVLGSSPSWSTNKKALAISMQVLFFIPWQSEQALFAHFANEIGSGNLAAVLQ